MIFSEITSAIEFYFSGIFEFFTGKYNDSLDEYESRNNNKLRLILP